jgi:hypothetical protein
MRNLRSCRCSLLLFAVMVTRWPLLLSGQVPPPIQNADGLRLMVAPENTQPTLRIVLPGHPDTDSAIEVIFPEHVTTRKQGARESEHLYLFRSGPQGEPPVWRQAGQSLQYEREFKDGVHMLARAMLEDDGVLFRYEFLSRSNVALEAGMSTFRKCPRKPKCSAASSADLLTTGRLSLRPMTSAISRTGTPSSATP